MRAWLAAAVVFACICEQTAAVNAVPSAATLAEFRADVLAAFSSTSVGGPQDTEAPQAAGGSRRRLTQLGVCFILYISLKALN